MVYGRMMHMFCLGWSQQACRMYGQSCCCVAGSGHLYADQQVARYVGCVVRSLPRPSLVLTPSMASEAPPPCDHEGDDAGMIDRVLHDVMARYPRRKNSLQKAKERVKRALDNGCCVEDWDGLCRAVETKLEFLDSITPGLGWKVFFRYTEEFMNQDAFELWSIMSGILCMTGFDADSMGILFKRHACLFANAVRDPDNLKHLFEWLQQNGLRDDDVIRVINRFPLILQTPVHDVLEPRVEYLCRVLGLDREVVVMSGILRHPELLSVESLWLQERIDSYIMLGLELDDVQKLFTAQPSAFAVDIDKYLLPMTRVLKDDLHVPDDLFVSILVKSGILSRSVSTIQSRIHRWYELGLDSIDVKIALKRFPRFLLYPIQEDKYKMKLEFLRIEMGLSIKHAIPMFPQYLSYSLENRIAPRVLAAKAITGKVPRLSTLAMSEKAYLKANKLHNSTYIAVLDSLPESKRGKRWMDLSE